MIQTIIVLGRQPELGLVELESLYGSSIVSRISRQVAGLEIGALTVNFKRLGGATRCASFIAEVPSKLWKDVEKELIRIVPELAKKLPDGKIQLGLSAIGIPVTAQKMIASGLTLKKVIRSKTNRSVRVTPNQEPELNTAQVIHNHLTGQTGIELLVIATDKGTSLIAQTVAVQDIDSYAERDRQRPKRDAKVGMLPPKLAQIILNLAAGNVPPAPIYTLLDPFCGTGVLLQEALLAGFSAYGTDLEQRMVDYSEANLTWLREIYNIDGESHLEKGDATNHTWTRSVTMVATETYLGRPFTDTPEPAILQTTIGDCNLIISKFLRSIRNQINSGTRLCLAVPAWQTAPHKFRHLPLIDDLTDMGYNLVSFEHAGSSQLLYYREDQIVARELLVLTRK